MNSEECCLITNGRCPYEIDNKCTSICGGDRPYGDALCDIEELKFKNEDEFKFTEEGLEEFLMEFSKAIKERKKSKESH